MPSRRPALPPRSRRVVVGASAGVAVLAAVAFADAAPTGLSAVDALLRGAFAALVVLVAYRGPRSALAPAAGGAMVAALVEPALSALALAGVATGLTLVSERFVGYRRAIKALAGGFLALALPRLGGGDAFHGDTALIVALLLVPLLVGTFRRLERAERRVARRVAAGIVIAGGLASGASGAGALSARHDVDDAVEAMEAGLDAARAADQAQAARHFEVAAALFADAGRQLSQWWVRTGRAVPIVAQNSRALEALSSIGGDLATTAARTARVADPDDARLEDGRVDLEAIAALVEPLEQTLDALGEARRAANEVRSPWLLSPLGDAREELMERAEDAMPDARRALRAARVTPGILGADGPRRYFVMFVTPAEARPSGGIIGNYAELTVTDGHIEMTAFGRNADLNRAAPPGTRELVAPADYVARYGDLRLPEFWQDVTFSPDFPSVAQAVEGLYPQSGGADLDGVISVDPAGLAALLKLTGPMEIPGRDEPLTAQNAPDVLLRDQYVRFADDKPGRVDFLEATAVAVFERLTRGSLPGPGKMADSLGPAVRGGRLKMHSAHPAEQAFFEAIGLSGRMPPVAGQFLGVYSGTASQSKVDAFLRREIEYDATVDPGTGRVEAVVTVTLHNDAPASGLPQYVIGGGYGPPGENLSYLAVYSPLPLVGADADGQPLALKEETELGRFVASGYVRVAAQSSVTVRVHLAGTVAMRVEDGRTSVRFDLAHQPLVEPDDVKIRLRLTPGWEVDGSRRGEIVRNLTLRSGITIAENLTQRAAA